MEPNHPRIGVGVIIRKENRFLLGRRRSSHGEGAWSFPGGHLEFGETIEDCVRREVVEETGLALGPVRLAGYTDDLFQEEAKHFVTVFMLTDWVSGEPVTVEPEKCDGWEWFRWNELPKPLFLPIQNLLRTGYVPEQQAPGH